MPGISLSTDTGEGRFINIRGIDGNLDGATFGGVPLLNTFPGGTYFSGGGRAVEFDTIPGGAIDGLIVTYTGLPDHEAEGLGGSVELTPRTAANIVKPFVDATIGWGVEPQHGHTGPFNADIAVGVRFGFDNGHLVVEGIDAAPAPRAGFISNPTPFAIVLTASARDDRRGFDDIEEDYNPAGTDRSYDDIQFRRYDYHRDRVAYGGEFDFTPNDDHRFYARANITGYTEAVKKNRLTFDFDPICPRHRSGTGFESPADLSVKSTDEQETHRNDVYAVGGQDRFGEVILDYRVSYSTASYDQAKNHGTNFVGPTVLTQYDNSANNGDFPRIMVTDGTDINDASLYDLKHGEVDNGQEHDRDREWAFAANLQFPLHLINDSSRIKIGAEVRLRTKTQNIYDEALDIGALNLADASTPAITDFYDNGYSNGPNVNTGFSAPASPRRKSKDQNIFDPDRLFQGAREHLFRICPIHRDLWQAGRSRWRPGRSHRRQLRQFRVRRRRQRAWICQQPAPVRQRLPDRAAEVRLHPDAGVARHLFNRHRTAGIQSGRRRGHSRSGQRHHHDGQSGPETHHRRQLRSGPRILPTGGRHHSGRRVRQGVFRLCRHQNQPRRQRSAHSELRGADRARQLRQRLVGLRRRGIEGIVASAVHLAARAVQRLRLRGQRHPGRSRGFRNTTPPRRRRAMRNTACCRAPRGSPPTSPASTKPMASRRGFRGSMSAPSYSRLAGRRPRIRSRTTVWTLDFASSYSFHDNWKIYVNVKNLLDTPLRFYVGNSSMPIQREFYRRHL